MYKILILLVFMFLSFDRANASNFEQVISGKSRNFTVLEQNGMYTLKYKDISLISRTGSIENWKKYSETEYFPNPVVQCLSDTSKIIIPIDKISDLPDDNNCLDSWMKQIFYISSNTVSNRYFIIGVGKIDRDWSSASFMETYLFDTISGNILILNNFSESSEGSGVKIQEGKSGIYIISGGDIILIEKNLAKILKYFTLDPEECKKQIKEIVCVNISELKQNSELSDVFRIHSIQLLYNKKIRLYIHSRNRGFIGTKVIPI